MSEEDVKKLLAAYQAIYNYTFSLSTKLSLGEDNPAVLRHLSELNSLEYRLKPENLPETLEKLKNKNIDPANYLAAVSEKISSSSQKLADELEKERAKQVLEAAGGPAPEDKLEGARSILRKNASAAQIREEDRARQGYDAAAAFVDQDLKVFREGSRKARNELVDEIKSDNIVEIQRNQDLLNSYHWYGGRFRSNSSEYDNLFRSVERLTELLGPVGSDKERTEKELAEIKQIVVKLKREAAAYLEKNGLPGTQGTDMGKYRATAAQYFLDLAKKIEPELKYEPGPVACLYGLEADPERNKKKAVLNNLDTGKVRQSSIEKLENQVNQKKGKGNLVNLHDGTENAHYKQGMITSIKRPAKKKENNLLNRNSKRKTERHSTGIQEINTGMDEFHT